MCPMVDGWKGDDWFHNGAFRQTNFDYLYSQTTARAEGKQIARGAYDDFQLFLDSGSAGDFAHRFGIDALPYYQKIVEHPAYDQFWSGQALDQILATQPLKTPTMYVTALYDQEDMYGGVHAYRLPNRRTARTIAISSCSAPGGTAASTTTAPRSDP